MRIRVAFLLCVLGCMAAFGHLSAQEICKVMTCNIRVALPQDTTTGNGWNTRRDICFEVMKKQAADVYCLQEVIYPQYKDLRAAFPDYLVFGYEGPEMDSMPDKAYHGIAKNVILFSRKRYELVGAGTYWLSEHPLQGGELSWGTARARHANWVRLEDKATGKQFRVLSIHLDHVSQEAREHQIGVVLKEASQYTGSMPQILCGDFNSRPNNPIIATMMKEAGWTDVYHTLHGQYEAFTTHRFIGREYHPKKTPVQIDYIFTHGGKWKIRDAHFVKDDVNGKYPSDHFFLVATLEMD